MSNWQVFLVALISGLPSLLTAIGGFLVVLRKVGGVHEIVNSQRTEMMEKITRLEKLLAAITQADAVNEEHRQGQARLKKATEEKGTS